MHLFVYAWGCPSELVSFLPHEVDSECGASCKTSCRQPGFQAWGPPGRASGGFWCCGVAVVNEAIKLRERIVSPYRAWHKVGTQFGSCSLEAQLVRNLPAMWVWFPRLGRSPGEGNSYPLQHSGLENSVDCISMGLQRVRHDWVTFTFTGAKGREKWGVTI